MPACLRCHDDRILQHEYLVDGDEFVWSQPCPDCAGEAPLINPESAEGAALLAAYGDLKRLEARTGEWPGADVVDIVEGLFTKLGFGLERDPDEVEQQLHTKHSRVEQPQVEVVGYRDEDGGTDIAAFLDGRPVTPEVSMVDPGAGWTVADWRQHREMETARASPPAAALIGEHYDRGEHSPYVSERGF